MVSIDSQTLVVPFLIIFFILTGVAQSTRPTDDEDSLTLDIAELKVYFLDTPNAEGVYETDHISIWAGEKRQGEKRQGEKRQVFTRGSFTPDGVSYFHALF